MRTTLMFVSAIINLGASFRPCQTTRIFFTAPWRSRVNRLSAFRLSSFSTKDTEHLQDAIQCAKHGFGVTFPNPAVGCVLVDETSGKVLGKGFHPRAGYPHAEVFALFEAAGLVPDGVAAATEVMGKDEGNETRGVVEDLLARYSSADGADSLFANLFADQSVTAYVTLEPCSHFGRTPPCAYSLATSKVKRVMVGFRDPNPRVDGGGVKLLRDAGVQVEMAAEQSPAEEIACSELVTNFVKRITPSSIHEDYGYVTGGMRRALRAMANRRKQDGSMAEMNWKGTKVEVDGNMEEAIDQLVLPARWMEELDAILWRDEIVMLKLNAAVRKKKGANLLGQRIAEALKAHVAQTMGHSCLLYRPGMPPVLDLEILVAEYKGNNTAE